MNAWDSDYKSHQGNLGLGRAIAYYTANCIPVLIPLNDTQKYDIAIDKEGLKRVSVKTTQHQTSNGNYEVSLKKLWWFFLVLQRFGTLIILLVI